VSTEASPGAAGLQPVPSPVFPKAIEQYLSVRVPVCRPDDTAAEIRTMLSSRSYDTVADVAVCADDGDVSPRLLGLIPAERVLAAPADAAAATLMDADPAVVAPGLDQEKAAWKAAQHGESSLAVVDVHGGFRGLVPPARLLAVLLREHDEDLARLGGFLAATKSARAAVEERLATRVWHRIPWLVLGLLGSAVAAWLVGGFERQLATDVRIAFFIPGVVYMADAVGTQTEALIIRGLSVGVTVRRVVVLEVLTGAAVGLLLGAATFPAVLLAFDSARLALAVSIALIAACGVATTVAMLLPWVMFRAGRDPAFGSGPLATVVQDLLSLVIYFGVATALL
jgi:magnesium transporter